MNQIERLNYNRADITPGIVHFGVGNFHRSHQAMYLDALFRTGRNLDWGITGVGLLPGDARMRDVLHAQDMTYTLVERHPDGTTNGRTIGSIVDFLFAPDDPEAVFEKLADPQTRIVSLTITEGGYNRSDVTGEFDPTSPTIVRDLEPGAIPSTVFGVIVEGLRRRRERGVKPFTIMSCDNIQGNGDVARASFTAFAKLLDSDLGTWVESQVAFPNSMVDRITPVTTDDDRDFVLNEYGVHDEWPVSCEPFVQWVLEDHFPLGRPDYDEVGVQLVDDVEPYEKMKLRLLNASHQAMAYFGYLMGYRLVDQAATDSRIVTLLTRYMDEEATPTLDPVPGIDLREYKQTLLERFANAYIRDTLARLGTDASDRIPKWLLPVVFDLLGAGSSVKYAAAIVASWAIFARGTDESGDPITVADRQSELVTAAAERQRHDSVGFLRDHALFGDLADDPVFSRAFVWAYTDIDALGAAHALEVILG